MAPLISIIINCYNGQEFLSEALDSVVSQTFGDWEIIFWDNHSVDNSARIFQSYHDDRFRYFLAENHTQLGAARNAAVDKAEGKWIAFLDCDDIWFPQKLELQVGEWKNNPDVGIIYSPVKLMLESEEPSAKALQKTLSRYNPQPHPATNIYRRLLVNNFIIFSSVLIRRNLFNEVKGIDCRLKQNEDYDILLKIANISKAICVKEPSLYYRIHANNNSHVNEQANYLENVIIYDALPQDKYVEEARLRNGSRYAIFYLRQFKLLSFFRVLISEGSVSWVVKLFVARILKKIQAMTTIA